MIIRSLLLIAISLPCYADFTGKVVGVTDGDTITVLVERTQVKVRLADIDAPERRQDWGSRAKEALSDMVFSKDVLVVEQSTDRYGRTIGRVYAGDLDVSASMVEGGHAWVYRRYSRDSALLELESEARKAGQGLWSLPEAIPPWEWRKIRKSR